MTEQPRPVTIWENQEAKGDALSAESVYRQSVERTEQLREQQAEYLASLPTDPTEVISAAWKIMHPEGEVYPEGMEEALHLSFALQTMVKYGDLDQPGPERDAALFVADRVVSGMCRAAQQLSCMSDILSNPWRIEREKKIAENLARFET